ncbi:MAG: lipase [Thiotrichaceae bacterium]
MTNTQALANLKKNSLIHKTAYIILCSIFGLTLSSCGDSTNFDFDNSPPSVAPSTAAAFSPASGGPTTNNLLLETVDTDNNGIRLNFPNPPIEGGELSPVRTALNTLDGFSTVNPITLAFAKPLDSASLILGKSIRVFKVNTFPNSLAISNVVSELDSSHLAVSATGTDDKTLALVPLQPLDSHSTYMVILTNSMKFSDGKEVSGSTDYLILRSQDDLTDLPTGTLPDLTQALGLQGLINSMENSAISFSTANSNADDDIAEADITLSWSFTTQTISTVLDGLANTTGAGAIVAAPVPNPVDNTKTLTTKDVNPAFLGIADVYIGTLDIPYYLTPPSAQNPTAPRTEFWTESNGLNSPPTLVTTLTVPLILTIPNAASGKTQPASGWPITMYQHGITRVRTDALIHADSLASQGIATIAIDLPLHGVTATDPTVNPLAAFHASNTPFPNDNELTFDLDFVNNATSAPGPDTNIDDSGAHFLNLSSLLTSRDNIRQGVVNLLVLRNSLGNIAGVTVDTNKVGLIAHSLGGLIGVPYLAIENRSTPTSLVTTAGGIAQLVNGSAAFGPVTRAGLAAANPALAENANLQAFFGAAQQILDSADAINFAKAAANNHPIHMIEVVGDGTDDSLPDQTVPNTVPQSPQPDPDFVPLSPLSGTEPLARIMGLQSIDSTAGANSIVRFTQGEHSTFLTPERRASSTTPNAELLDVFVEMHSQAVSFQVSSGTAIVITDDSDIKAVAQP